MPNTAVPKPPSEPWVCAPSGIPMTVLSPAGTLHQVHRRDAAPGVVPYWFVLVVPQVMENRMAGAPGM